MYRLYREYLLCYQVSICLNTPHSWSNILAGILIITMHRCLSAYKPLGGAHMSEKSELISKTELKSP